VTPAVGDFNGDGKMELAMITRAGELFVWKTDGAACQTREWPKYQHDLRNSGNYSTDAEPPSVVGGLRAIPDGSSLTLSWRAPGGDDNCGAATRYMLRVNGSEVSSGLPVPAAAGTMQTMSIPAAHVHTVTLQAQDAAGNLGIPVTLTLRHGEVITSTATSMQSRALVAPSDPAEAKPAGVTGGLLGGSGALMLMVGLAAMRRRRA
jgi:hypothetical protein